jgi:hypothetical protein
MIRLAMCMMYPKTINKGKIGMIAEEKINKLPIRIFEPDFLSLKG